MAIRTVSEGRGSLSGTDSTWQARAGAPVPPTTKSAAIAPRAHDPEPGAFGRILRSIGEETRRGEAMVHRSLSASAAGRDFGPSELIALQAGVYRYSEVVDLAAKLVDRASSGVKTVITGQ